MGRPDARARTSLGPGMPSFPHGGRCMKRLDALEWADGLCLTAWGLRVGIRVTHPQVLEGLGEVLPPGWKPSTTRKVQLLYSWASAPPRRREGPLLHTLYSGPHHLNQGSDLLRLRHTLAWDIQAHLALLSPWRVFLHAGVVGWKGRAIVLPGRSGAGKSTLTAAFVRAGATFFSDEFAVLDRRGWAHPYPLPLRFKKDEGPGSRRVPVAELGGEASARPLPVGLIAAVRYQPGGECRFHELTPGRGAMELMAQAAQARLHPQRVMRTVGRTAAGALVLKGRRGEAEAAVRSLLARMEG